MNRPVTTLFMLMSVDGKISTGSTDEMDVHHLMEHGVRYICELSKQAVVITTNASHPAFHVDADNLHIIYQEHLELNAAFSRLKNEFGCKRLTVQSGGNVNGLLLREKLLDYVDIVVAPVLIGGRETSTLIDRNSLVSNRELSELGVLKLLKCSVLQDSYLRLRYEVVK